MLRLFVALSVPADAAARLTALQPGLPGRPVPPENLHLTLAFLGDTAEPVAEDVDLALDALRCPPFQLWLDGVGAFGGAKPRNLHALARPEPTLTRLRDKVVRAVRGAGASVDAAKFTPHVTLSRLNAGAASAAAAAKALQARAAFLAGPITVADFALYRSELTHAAPRYTALRRYPLLG